ncbi:type II toxin-antitoxin system VapC family toxin [Pistricoccus aurantiacus]|uniref:Ribonuclease VapC n=1 Tax=Pistricoccus aurantiacus TaxID=1883414 RepID=A0A5B8SSJ9_9GAMM|nr:type II toxin-antitoxin system VapC family toxin [Pistricoccus aurantiacus]QEA40049.1 type II toxin-antitoxin system VapC family toxin [Pistricoccus aurantiacus]
MLYIDTSALLPYYRQESSSAAVQNLLFAQTQPVLISPLTEVELASALARWVRTKELTEPQANRIESAFQEDIAAGRFEICQLGSRHYQRARHWLLTRKTALRTLDALHMACAETHQATLVTQDEALMKAATYFGLDAQPAKE